MIYVRSTDRLAAFGAPYSRSGEPGVYSFLDDRTLKLREYAEHLKERPSGWCCRVDRLLFEVEIAARCIEFTEKPNEVLQ